MWAGKTDAGHAKVQRFNFYFLALNHNMQVKTYGNSCPLSTFLNHGCPLCKNLKE
jgi:hypothetical protein